MTSRVQAPPIRVPTHGLTRYLRATVEVTDGIVRWAVPRTILGLIPVGTRLVAVPVADVESIRVGRGVRPLRLLAGLAAVVTPWFLLPWWASLPLLVVGVWVVLVALGPQLMLTTRDNRPYRAPVCFAHQLDAELYIAALEYLVGRADGRQ